MLLDLLPKLRVLLNADLLGGVELVEAAKVHVLGEQGNDVLVKSLPVRVLKVVPMARYQYRDASLKIVTAVGMWCALTFGCPRSRNARQW